MEIAISFRKHGISTIKQNITEDIFSLPEVYMPIVFSHSSIAHTRKMNLIKKTTRIFFPCFLNYFITLLKPFDLNQRLTKNGGRKLILGLKKSRHVQSGHVY